MKKVEKILVSKNRTIFRHFLLIIYSFKQVIERQIRCVFNFFAKTFNLGFYDKRIVFFSST